VPKLDGHDFPDHLLYDVENQVWYEPLADGSLRAGFTSWAVALMGEVIVFTPKRIGKDFEPNKWFAMVEGGKWIGAACAAFEGVVAGHNEALEKKPSLLMTDPFGAGWMVTVKPSASDWRDKLTSGDRIASVFEGWLAAGKYKDRGG
jgi:glycine cleavage system H protein